jgi:hypothetical protein
MATIQVAARAFVRGPDQRADSRRARHQVRAPLFVRVSIMLRLARCSFPDPHDESMLAHLEFDYRQVLTLVSFASGSDNVGGAYEYHDER